MLYTTYNLNITYLIVSYIVFCLAITGECVEMPVELSISLLILTALASLFVAKDQAQSIIV